MHTPLDDTEVINDSEEERSGRPEENSRISAFTPHADPNDQPSEPDTSLTVASIALDKNGRPKPRPRKRGLNTASDPIQFSSVLLDPQVQRLTHSDSVDMLLDMPSSIADRAKTRQRSTKKNVAQADESEFVIDITSEDELVSSVAGSNSSKDPRSKKQREVSPVLDIPAPFIDSSFPLPPLPPPPRVPVPRPPVSSLPPSSLPDTSMDAPPIECFPGEEEEEAAPPRGPKGRRPSADSLTPLTDDDMDQDIYTDTVVVVTKKKKPTKPRKKFGDLDDAFYSDSEDEWTEKPKAKAKKKKETQPKKRATKASKDTDGQPMQKKGKAKSRAKAKETVAPKSADFVDSEADEDVALIAPTPKPASPPRVVKAAAPPVGQTQIIPDSDGDEEVLVPPTQLRRPSKRKALDEDEKELEESPKRRKSSIAKPSAKSKGKGKARAIFDSSDDDIPATPRSGRASAPRSPTSPGRLGSKTNGHTAKENDPPAVSDEEEAPRTTVPPSPFRHRPASTTSSPTRPNPATPCSPSRRRPRHSTGSTLLRTKSTPMTDIIRRANSRTGSPFPPTPASSRATAYSPFLKSSRSMLSKIAPLHARIKEPPAPLPRPPPRKKTKKELEREEKWEEEVIEFVGVGEWAVMDEDARKRMLREKRDMEMMGWDD